MKRERMLGRREGENRREKVKEVDEKGRGIRERNVDTSRDGRLGRVDKTHGRRELGGRKIEIGD